MCAYNRVNGDYACENDWLLNTVLKKDWGYKGYVMSDWGATTRRPRRPMPASTRSRPATLRQAALLRRAAEGRPGQGEVSQARLDDMARRILRSMFASGVFDHPVKIARSTTPPTPRSPRPTPRKPSSC
jgi:beta-glucosidase